MSLTIIVQAQGLNITVSVTTEESGCYVNGKILVKFNGSDLDKLNASDQINFYSYKTGSNDLYRQHDYFFDEISEDYSFALEGYAADSYTLDYTIWHGGQEIKESVSNIIISGDYESLYAWQSLGSPSTLYGTRPTLNCKPTGRIQLEIMQGKFPYSVQIYKDGQLFRTDVFNAHLHSGDDPHAEDYRDYYDLNGLGKGNYTFIVSDACGYEVKLDGEVVRIDEVNCPPNIASVASIDTDESEVIFSLPDKFFNEAKYDDNLADWLEFRFKSEDGAWTEWQDYTESVSDKVADIQNIYGKKYIFEVRAKGCAASMCSSELTITKTSLPPSPSCNENKDILVSLSPIPGTGGFFCPCMGGTSTPNYYDKYTISLNYTVCDPTLPLTYQVYDQTASAMLVNVAMPSSGGHKEERVRTPEEGHTLHISLKDAGGKVYIDTLIIVPTPPNPYYTPPTPLKWTAGHEVIEKGCDKPIGSVGVSLNCRVVPKGTKVELIQAPNNYSFTAEYTEGAINPWTITSNSSDFKMQAEEYLCARRLNMIFEDLFHYGTYKWRITDDSGRDDIVIYSITDNFKQYRVTQGLSFTTKKNCHGTLYYPQAQIESFSFTNPSVTKKEQTKFRVIAGNPTGYEINGGTATIGICNQDALLITKPGSYTIQLFYNPDGDEPIDDLADCTTASTTITYIAQSLSFRDYYGYLCANEKNGTIQGSISVFVKNGSGVPPYSFYLYSGDDSSGKLITSNQTGVFDNIVSGSARFFVRVEDACHSSLGVAIPLTPIITSDIIFGDRNVCTGSQAYLSGKMIGAGHSVSYQWIGDHGFSSTDRQIITPPVLESSAYSLEISGLGCKISDNITVEPSDEINIYYEDLICRGTNYNGGSEFRVPLQTDHLEAGLYNFSSGPFLAQNGGCDSIAHLKLHIIEDDSVIDEARAVCTNQFPILWNGMILNEGTSSGIHTIPKTKNGCKYSLRLDLTVNPAYNDTLPEELICNEKEVRWNGKSYTESGYYTNRFILPTGCDSLITLHLTVNPTNRIVLHESIFEGSDYRKYNFNLSVQNKVGEVRDSILLQNQYGCDSMIVLYLSVLSTDIVIPEGFSPNGDGINDYFVIKNIELYPNNHILIFNRWGNKLYEGKPYMNKWDGRNYEGGNIGTDVLPVGTYFYILDLGDGSKAKKGFIYLTQ